MTHRIENMPARIAAATRKTREIGNAIPRSTIGRAVSDACARFADRVAIEVFERGERSTFAEFETLTHRYARALSSLGRRPWRPRRHHASEPPSLSGALCRSQ